MEHFLPDRTYFWLFSNKKPKRTNSFRLFLKGWRQPTLAESIRPLPSARLCLTAEFGMGSGRTTALWPPKIRGQRSERLIVRIWSGQDVKEQSNRRQLVTCHTPLVTFGRSLKTA